MVPVPVGVRPASVGTCGAATGSASWAAIEPGGGVGAERGGVGVGGQGAPGVVEVGADVVGELAHLGLGQQAGVVLRVALAGQPVALDGVGEHHGGAGVVDGVEGVEQGAEVVPAEVADRGVDGVVVDGEQRGDLPRVVGVPSPGMRSRSWAGVQRSSRWYSGLVMASMRRRSAAPPSRV